MTRLRICALLLLLFVVIDAEDPKKIFLYNPHLGYYHVQYMVTIANHLKAAGHNVTILDSLVYKNLPDFKKADGINVITVDQHNITGEITENGENLDSGLRAFWDEMPGYDQLTGLFSYYEMKGNFSTMMSYQCKKILESGAIDDLKEEQYDLFITEVFDFCGVGMSHVLKPAKTILASSVPLHEHIGELLGLPKSFDQAPTKFAMSTLNDHREEYNAISSRGFYENAITSAIFAQNMFGYLIPNQTRLYEEYYERMNLSDAFPGMKSILKGAHSLLENVHPLLDINKPTLSSFVPIGGITARNSLSTLKEEQRKLAESILSEMDEEKAKNKTVVLVSFGTVMDPKTMKMDTKKNLIRALESVTGATFFWKVNQKAFFPADLALPLNIKAYKWMPQNELLASGKVDLFVSHMGIGSMTEAAYSGVPLVSVPIFVDQHYNYACAKRLGIARFVDKASLAVTPDALSFAIQAALDDGAMKKKSVQLKKNLEAHGNQTENMMKHIEFILSLDDSAPIAFQHHHEGISVGLALRSLIHLMPYYAVPICCLDLALLACLFLWYRGVIVIERERVVDNCLALFVILSILAVVTIVWPFLVLISKLTAYIIGQINSVRLLLFYSFLPIYIVNRAIPYFISYYLMFHPSFSFTAHTVAPTKSLVDHCRSISLHLFPQLKLVIEQISDLYNQYVFPIINPVIVYVRPHVIRAMSAFLNYCITMIISVIVFGIAILLCPDYFSQFQK